MYDVTQKPTVANQAQADVAQSSSIQGVKNPVAVTKVAKGEKSAADNTNDKRQNAGPEEAKKAVEELNEALSSMNVKRQFTVEDSTNEVVVKIIDTNDDKVIRQIPTEEAVKLSKNIKDMAGMLYDKMT